MRVLHNPIVRRAPVDWIPEKMTDLGGLPALNKTCPKCGFTITPDLVKRMDFEQIECPKCGEKFQPRAR